MKAVVWWFRKRQHCCIFPPQRIEISETRPPPCASCAAQHRCVSVIWTERWESYAFDCCCVWIDPILVKTLHSHDRQVTATSELNYNEQHTIQPLWESLYFLRPRAKWNASRVKWNVAVKTGTVVLGEDISESLMDTWLPGGLDRSDLQACLYWRLQPCVHARHGTSDKIICSHQLLRF